MLRQASSYLFANIVSAALGFVAVVIFTRVLAPEDYGVYVVGLSTASLLSALFFGWIKSSIVPLGAGDSGSDLRLTATLALVGMTALAPPLYFAMAALFPGMSGYLAQAILLAFAIGLFELCLETFRARQETRAYLVSTIVRAALALVLSLVLVLGLGWGGIGLLVSISLSYLVTSLGFARAVWRGPRKPFDKDLFRTMLVFGLPMTVSGAVFMLQALLDRFVVASQMGEHAAGIYGASADLVRQIILFPGVAIGSAIAPIAITLLAKGEKEKLHRHLTQSTELLLGLLAPATIGLAIMAEKLAFLVFGEEFRPAAALLIPIIAMAWLMRSVSYQLVHVSFQMTRKPSLMVVQGLLTLLVNAVALFVLVPRFGLSGAAWALVISELAGLVAGYGLASRAHPLPLDPMPWLRVGLASALMAIPTLWLDRQLANNGVVALVLPIILGVALYGLAAYGLDIAQIRSRAVQWKDRRQQAPAE